MDIKVLRRCQKGERKAQTLVYRAFAPKMFAVCFRYAPDFHSAEDILQDGFVKVFSKLDTFKNDGSFEGWIRRIMINTALEHIRKNAPTDRYQEIGESEPLENGVAVLDMLSADEISRAMQQLPDGYREVVNLFIIDGYTHAEIAALLEISISNSKLRLMRGRQMLIKTLKELNIQNYESNAQHR